MNLLIVTDGITPFVVGGMQKHSANLTRELVRLGHQVTLMHCVSNGSVLPNRAAVLEVLDLKEEASLKTICISFPKAGVFPGHYLKESYIYSQRCYKAIKNELHSFDFIYAKGFASWYFVQEKAKGISMPPIGVKFHGYEMFQPPVNFKMRLQNWLLQSPVKWINQRADFVFSYGGKITKLIEKIGVPDKNIIEIPTGIDASWIKRDDKRTNTKALKFLFIGRFERRKGIEELHAVLPLILQNREVEFQFLGPIPHSKRFKHDKVTYHGQLTHANDIRAVIDDCDVLLTPSHSEGMPNVIMEAMARGLAVLATDVGAVSSVVGNDNGILMEFCTVELLQSAIETICALNKQDIHRMQVNSQAKIQSFTWDQIAARTADEIKQRRSGML